MNLQPLFDLKERLDHAAIAGSALLQEDFRLRRAVDGMAPLASASPVFQKIQRSAQSLLNAPEDRRSTLLLDVMSLVDAVVYTQGISDRPGELMPLPTGTGTYHPIPYSRLTGLINALSGSGSGKLNTIRELWDTDPDVFSDFRVQPYLIRALGDHAPEIPGLISSILARQGRGILPLLKEGFDPEGKTEMIRRLELISVIAGETENQWYLSVLPDSKRFVRMAVIRALGDCQENTQTLIWLCQTERGKLKDAALHSLARMDSDEAVTFWQEEVARHPTSISVLEGVFRPFAADLAAEAVKKCLVGILANDKKTPAEAVRLQERIRILYGKYSEQTRALWLWAAEHMDALSTVSISSISQHPDITPSEQLQRAMLLTILWNPAPEVLHLAHTLAEKCPDWFDCCAILADLITLSPEEFYDAYSHFVTPAGFLGMEKPEQEQRRIQFMRAMSPVMWDTASRTHCLHFAGPENLHTLNGERRIPLSGIDPRWVIRLSDHGIVQHGRVFGFDTVSLIRMEDLAMETILMNLITPTDPESCRVCGQYLYRRVKVTGQLAPYQDALIRCGWREWSGLPAYCVQKKNQVVFFQLINQLASLPMTNRERSLELRQIDELVRTGRISAWNRIWPSDQIAELIIRLETDENAKLG